MVNYIRSTFNFTPFDRDRFSALQLFDHWRPKQPLETKATFKQPVLAFYKLHFVGPKVKLRS